MGTTVGEDVGAAGAVSVERARELVEAVPSWHHRMEVVPGVWSSGNYDPRPMLAQMGLPERLDGVRALDIGCNDGFFAFELERRGASVVAIDFRTPSPGFALTHRLRDSSVEFRADTVYAMTAARHGTFDLVLFLGVLYHLRHPLLAIDVLSTLTRPGGTLFVESHAIDRALVGHDGNHYAMGDPSMQLMQFYPRRELLGDESNWWAPTLACTEAMLESATFRVEFGTLWMPSRLLVRAYRDPSLEPEYYLGAGGFAGDSAAYWPAGSLDPAAE